MNQKIEFDKECIIESFEECQTAVRKFYCKLNVLDCDKKRKQFNFFNYNPIRDLPVFQESYNQVFNFIGILNPDGFNIVNDIIHVPEPQTDFIQIKNKLFDKNKELKTLVSFLKENIVKKKYKQLLFGFLSDRTFLKQLINSPISNNIAYSGSVLHYLNYSLKIIKQNMELFESDFILNSDIIYCAMFMYYVPHIKNISIKKGQLLYSRKAELLGKKIFYLGDMSETESYPQIHSILLQMFTDSYQSTIEGTLFKKMYWLSNRMFILKYSIDNCEKIDDVINVQIKNQKFNLIYPSSAWMLSEDENENI